jgi:chromosomal replication initiation ATPase DnaA
MQLSFPFTQTPAYGEESYFVSACNHEAHAWIMRWPHWPSHGLIIIGEPGAGKTHLAHIWQQRSQAHFLTNERLTAAFDPAALEKTAAFIVEDAEKTLHAPALFHLLNWVREQNGHILLTSHLPPSEWNITLPDLLSRLNALPAATVNQPDDELLCALLTKLFADRQLHVPMNVTHYLATHMERSFNNANQIVNSLDTYALSSGRNINTALAKEILENL